MARSARRPKHSTSGNVAAPGEVVREIRVRGARGHNLRDLDVDLPRGRLVVLTGVSGSGKSSLAFDTLYAEGQRRYIESLSVYARQYLDQLERPDVDQIEGLPPTVAIDQRPHPAGARSTVGTITEVYDYLRLLYARAGVPHCPNCAKPILRQSPEEIVSDLLALPDGSKVIVMAPLVRGRKGEHREAFDLIRRAGLIRARVDGEFQEVQDAPSLARNKQHTIEAVVDRLVIREGIRPRLAESIDRALQLGNSAALLSIQREPAGTWDDHLRSVHLACPDCGLGLAALEPRWFSFNSPYGACPGCDGLGTIPRFDPDLLVTAPEKPLHAGAIAALHVVGSREVESFLEGEFLVSLMRRFRVTKLTPLSSWPSPALRHLLGGTDADDNALIPWLERLDRESSRARRIALSAYRRNAPCPACDGTRLKPEARAVTIGGLAIHQLTAMPVSRSRAALESLIFDSRHALIGPPIVKEACVRLAYLAEVGLDYLSLDRSSESLSGGELQRVRLAAQIGSGLVGVAFVFDEPTAGLHPRDTEQLLTSLRRLRDAGNSVLVVEHDESVIRAADWVIDLGPGAGPEGGRIVAQGPPSDLEGPESITLRYLNRADSTSREKTIEATRRQSRVERANGSWIIVKGAREHNLKGDEARFPIGAFTCVTGVSGSGKSSLVLDVLARAARSKIAQPDAEPAASREEIEGLEAIDKLIVVDQTPIGRTPRSTPATYTGVFDEIRKVFRETREARVRGYGAKRFSFNTRGGRCEPCHGQGVRRIETRFLPEMFVRCEHCNGKRFNPQTLQVRFKGASIGDVLEMRVDEALPWFDAVPQVRRGLEALHHVGLGYITLGQASTTLSGGESQRIKLATELGRPGTGRTLYVLDEPTTGLHFADVESLLGVFDELVNRGNTLVVIEHNLAMIRSSDWVVDLGPEGGEAGGHVVVMGTPDEVASSPESYTGASLRAQGR